MKVKLYNIILSVLALISIAAFGTVLFYQYYVIEEVYVYNADAVVANKMGINADNDAFHFGTIIPGNFGRRRVDITHNYDHDIKVNIIPLGDLKEWIVVDPNKFVLEKNHTKTVSLTLNVPKDAHEGNYTGKVKIIMMKNLL